MNFKKFHFKLYIRMAFLCVEIFLSIVLQKVHRIRKIINFNYLYFYRIKFINLSMPITIQRFKIFTFDEIQTGQNKKIVVSVFVFLFDAQFRF